MKRILFVFLVITTSAFAQFAGGDGSVGNPYQIATATQFNTIRSTATNKYYKLIADINLDDLGVGANGNWVTDVSGHQIFLDGNNHTIRNLKQYTAAFNFSNTGLFSTINNGYIKNLKMVKCSLIDTSNTHITSMQYCSFLVGSSTGILKNIQIDSSVFKYRYLQMQNISYFGGIIGYSELDTLYRCSLTNSTIEMYGSITASLGSLYIGAIVGQIYDRLKYMGQSYSYNTSIKGSTDNTHSGFVGALIGNIFSVAIGGIVEDCYFYGRTNINVTSGGAIVGFVQGIAATTITMRRCYSVCTNLNPLLPTILGWTGQNQKVFYSYFDKDIIGTSKSASLYTNIDTAIARTTTQMKNITTYDVSWDFINIWGINTTINDGYPYLRWSYMPITAIKRLRVRR